jgi:glycosyltransferase involved in cell wall biosynthesis
MKTILIAHNYSEVSFASMSYHLAHYLANMGNSVVFISHQPYFSEIQVFKKDKGEVIVISWPTEKRPTSVKDVIWFSKQYFKYKPDVVIGHFVGSNITVSVSKILSLGRVKTFEYYHTLSTQILQDLEKKTFKQRLFFLRKKIFYKLFCDWMICPSIMAKNDLELFHNYKKGIVLLNPMVDRFINKEKIPNDEIIISYLGRLDTSKGVLDFIYAFENYNVNFPNSRIILKIAGSGSQGDSIKEKSIKNNAIEFLGGLTYENIDAFLNQSHFTIIPSKFDNLPTVGLEAMMNQTPLLISNMTGLSDYLTEGKECFKFQPTIDGMEKLFYKVEKNFNKHKEMGIEARTTFLLKFSIKKYCEDFSQIILK